MAEGHTTWDWNVANHTAAIEFYSELVKANPDSVLSHECLLDNLIADHRADEAEKVLNRLCALEGFKPFLAFVYRAHIALARFDVASADRIIEDMVETHAQDTGCLFEAAQYYAKKCDYDTAISYYERDFECDPKRPRFMDALQGIAEIYQIMEIIKWQHRPMIGSSVSSKTNGD